MILLLALQVEALRVAHPGSPIGAYQNCMAPIVLANERADKVSYQPLEKILDRIQVQCAKERDRAADALVGQILHQNPDLSPPPTEEEREQLISSATIRWANDLLAKMATEGK
jgi:hypothetical protein